jgi:transposase
MKKSVRLRRNEKGFWCDIFFEKEKLEVKKEGKKIGIDIGINKLLSLSEGTQLGERIKGLINKLNRKRQRTKGWYRCLDEIKNYIGEQVNKIPFKECCLIVLERIRLACEMSRVQLREVNPAYTSQTCRRCGYRSRGIVQEKSLDVWSVGLEGMRMFSALNILERFTTGVYSPCSQT